MRYYILPTEKIPAASEMTEVLKDSCSSTFCVPMVCKHSPLAYNIVGTGTQQLQNTLVLKQFRDMS